MNVQYFKNNPLRTTIITALILFFIGTFLSISSAVDYNQTKNYAETKGYAISYEKKYKRDTEGNRTTYYLTEFEYEVRGTKYVYKKSLSYRPTVGETTIKILYDTDYPSKAVSETNSIATIIIGILFAFAGLVIGVIFFIISYKQRK